MAQKKGRLNGNQNPVVKRALLKRDGLRCWICRAKYKEEQLIIEDVLGTGDHTRLDLLKLACESCNGRKNSRGQCRVNPRRGLMIDDLLRPKTMTAEMRKNEECEQPFRRWVTGILEELGELPL